MVRRSMFNITSLVRPITRVVGAAALLLALTGCGAIISSTPVPQLRVVTASPDAPRLDIYQGPNALAHNLGFGTVTSYIPLSPGNETIAANTAGTRQVLSASKANFATSGQYTVLIGSTAASLQQLTLTDQSQPAPAGQIALRFLNQATHSGPIDIYLVPAGQRLVAVAPTVANTLFGANTGYLNLPAGAYSLVAMPAGTIPPTPSLAIYSGPQVTYPSGAARTIILIDPQQPSAPGLQVITASDFDPAAN
ncbi:DUF4397 domain-containing protein [Tunturiibacter empetritectus]|uniref:DUF4397 domain-containing protein n=1 Tax=Tunturiibacter lichenicola TaxID=2051959 RepID=A0A852VA73_9BACT|nr:DUF4397 domain-containing protein [Edaphobacter lichenicola]NYF88211.1 hypothetical protein [Edaphobacter lichenicola]